MNRHGDSRAGKENTCFFFIATLLNVGLHCWQSLNPALVRNAPGISFNGTVWAGNMSLTVICFFGLFFSKFCVVFFPFSFLFFFLSLPQLRHISYVKTKLKPWIPQVFCHWVCLLIQSASMDPFFAHYQDQDWKKRDREGTFREGAEITQVKREEEHRAKSSRQDETATGGGQWHKKYSCASVWRLHRA